MKNVPPHRFIASCPVRPLECYNAACGKERDDGTSTIPVPLLRSDPAVDLNLNQALRTAYRRAHYDLRIDNRSACDPPLAPYDAAWTAALIAGTTEA